MPARKRISTRAIEEAPMDASSAISALPKQKQSVLEIASDGSSDSTARRSWCNATRAILAAAFVSDSLKIGEVTSAGPHHQMYPYGTSDFVMKTHARENLGAAAIMLDSCVEQRQLLAPVTSPSDRGAQEKPPPGRRLPYVRPKSSTASADHICYDSRTGGLADPHAASANCAGMVPTFVGRARVIWVTR